MKLIGELYARGLILTWIRDRSQGWELTSGAWSPFYFMFRHVPFFPELFHYSIDILTSLVDEVRKKSSIDVLVGVASTGIPLASGVALSSSLPLAYTRKIAGLRTIDDLALNSTEWGQHSLVEGQFKSGMKYLLVDDVVTGGASKLLAKRQVELEAERQSVNLEYSGTIVVVDRGFPGLNCSGMGVIAAHLLYDEVEQIIQFGGTQLEVQVIRHYLEDPNIYQDPNTRVNLLKSSKVF